MSTSPQFLHPDPQAPTHVEQLEEAPADTGLAVASGLRAVEIAAAVLFGLLVCPPLLVATVVVVVPLVAMAIVVSLVAAVIATPYVLVRRLRGHEVRHATVYRERARHAARAVADLLPHRVARAAR